MTSLLRRVAPALAGVLAALAAAAPSAMAGTDNYFTGGLSPGRLYASTTAHSAVYYMQANKNHRACIGLSEGWGGYAPPGTGNYYNENCTNGSALVYAYPGRPSGFYHSAVYNDNVSTDVSVSNAYYSW